MKTYDIEIKLQVVELGTDDLSTFTEALRKKVETFIAMEVASRATMAVKLESITAAHRGFPPG